MSCVKTKFLHGSFCWENRGDSFVDAQKRFLERDTLRKCCAIDVDVRNGSRIHIPSYKRVLINGWDKDSVVVLRNAGRRYEVRRILPEAGRLQR